MSSYKLTSVTLTESYLKREGEISFKSEESTPFEINIGFQNTDGVLLSVVTLQIKDDNKEISTGLEIKITMVGIFEIDSTPQFSVEQFANINAPAIIFPFIREHLASLTMKAGINPAILLPPINFVKMAEEQKNTKAIE